LAAHWGFRCSYDRAGRMRRVPVMGSCSSRRPAAVRPFLSARTGTLRSISAGRSDTDAAAATAVRAGHRMIFALMRLDPRVRQSPRGSL
jgi:hypothetical protein